MLSFASVQYVCFGLIWLAQMSAFPTWPAQVVNLGIAGFTIGWLMKRVEKRMDAQQEAMRSLETAVERQTKAVLLLVVSMDRSDVSRNDEAKQMIRDIENAR